MPSINNGQFRLNIGQFDAAHVELQVFDPIGKMVFPRSFAGTQGFSGVLASKGVTWARTLYA